MKCCKFTKKRWRFARLRDSDEFLRIILHTTTSGLIYFPFGAVRFRNGQINIVISTRSFNFRNPYNQKHASSTLRKNVTTLRVGKLPCKRVYFHFNAGNVTTKANQRNCSQLLISKFISNLDSTCIRLDFHLERLGCSSFLQRNDSKPKTTLK